MANLVADIAITKVAVPPLQLPGLIRVPDQSGGLIIFAHGSGSSHLSERNNYVADALARASFATLLFDLLTPEEELDCRNVFDIGFLAERLIDAIHWAMAQRQVEAMPIGLFGASTGAAAALVAAGRLGRRISAVVSRGGRPDLAGDSLADVHSPTLLIVGGNDAEVLKLNSMALECLCEPKQLLVVPGASHLFPEPGALDMVVYASVDWFAQHLRTEVDPATAI